LGCRVTFGQDEFAHNSYRRNRSNNGSIISISILNLVSELPLDPYKWDAFGVVNSVGFRVMGKSIEVSIGPAKSNLKKEVQIVNGAVAADE
jgi:hypothetical protein